MNPFDMLKSLLSGIWQWVKGVFNVATASWRAWLAGGGLTATLALFDWGFEMVADGAEGLAALAATVAGFVHQLPINGTIMGWLARCVPLNAILLGELFLLSVYIVAIPVRWIKSWIPTLS